MNLTIDEQQLMAIFNAGTREGTIAALEKMRTELEPDETELRELVDITTGKLQAMTNSEFVALDIAPDFR